MTSRGRTEQCRDRLIGSYQDRLLFEYVFEASLARELAPRPYFHPVRTLGGVTLTDHQPSDHRWHLGLAYSWPVVDEWNLWGGPTFVRDRGYVDLDNRGQIRHLSWIGHHEQLEWLDKHGSRIATEHRLIGEPEVDAAAGAWWLELDSVIETTCEHGLRIGSPTTEGRPLAGYAGLAWRGPMELRDARVIFEDPQPRAASSAGNLAKPASSGGSEGKGAAGEVAMGHRSRWLGYVAAGMTLGFFEHSANPGVPNRWFVRTEEYPLVTCSPVFDTELRLIPGAQLRLRHRVLFADGEWNAARLSEAASAFERAAHHPS